MSTISTRSLEMPYLYHDLVNDRIQTLHREAEEQRLVSRIRRVQRARRKAQQANDRLSRILREAF
ncbi:hypothetical protein ACWGH8_41205 [Nonomuraea muscovyensis]|uniref:Uncharacterized protein n=1 Tax=Nonomuraea muscovyensis TaxID=1124761 RepID=A0A7X0EUV1_9ACTN|nr:hypothetical protein [Nonomuraea muscovyensis]MBB6344838.1 hypothetical protein [Nonomuraea muscovyensis]